MKNTKSEKSIRKLHTRIETLRTLLESDLEKVAGGVATTATSLCTSAVTC